MTEILPAAVYLLHADHANAHRVFTPVPTTSSATVPNSEDRFDTNAPGERGW